MSNNKKQKSAVVYVRCSTDDQMKGLSPEVQEKLCRKRAEEENYRVLEVIIEDGISGFKESRPGINHLRELISQDKASAVVALSSDRLFRNTSAHIEFMNTIFDKGIRVLYVHQMSPENNATSIMTDTVLATVNKFYRDQVSDKVKATLYAKVDAGYFPSTPSPGYVNADNPDAGEDRFAKKIIVPDPVMAPLVTEIFQLYATGVYSVYDLTDMMNRRGLRSHKGYELSPSRVYDLLRNRIYLGEVKWGKAFNKNGKHTPIIDEATFNQVQTVLETNNHKACRRRKYQWLLSAFLWCASHNKRYVAEWHGAVAYYHCQNKAGCGKYSGQVDIENQVAEKFRQLEFSKEFSSDVIESARRQFMERRKKYESRHQALINQKTALEGKRKVAEDKLMDKVISDEDFTRIRADIKTQLSSIAEELIDLEDQREVYVDIAQDILLLAQDIYKSYKKASFKLKRHLLSFFWERFEVADGVILKSVSSPLFIELLQAEKVYFKTAEKTSKSKNAENTMDSSESILTTPWLRR